MKHDNIYSMKKITYLFILAFIFGGLAKGYTQKVVQKVEPAFWWAGMANPELQLLIYGENVAALNTSLEGCENVELVNVMRLKNPNYLVLNLRLKPEVKPGKFKINFKKAESTVFTYDYELKKRAENSAQRKGFDPSDVLYLITPDRFANGNPKNDTQAGMKEKLNRKNKDGRHGGDIKGIADNLDYIKDMGFTAIWLNPVLENDMKDYSYHGYATTDFYKVDGRFGSNEEYRQLCKSAKAKGIRVIMDMIVNHCGSEHWWLKDPPMADWVNHQKASLKKKYTNTSHRKTVIQDPYAAKADVKELTDGWFVPTMPDLNQRNPIMAKYLIQNSIWWVEYADLSGIRMDTYSYSDRQFMSEWTCKIMAEYPNLNIVGEEWFYNPAIVSYWQKGKKNRDGYTSCLPSLMDFPLRDAVAKGLNDKEEMFSGWISAYETLANDFLYADAYNLVIFPDNHDMSRFYTQVNENDDLFKLGITYFLTMRGIPQLYYGTEILMKNPGTGDHGVIRSDFPGGWKGDVKSAFTQKGLTTKEKEAQQFCKKLLNWRKSNIAIHKGKLIHYAPKQGAYVYFRYHQNKKVMVVLSKNPKTISLDLSRFAQVLGKSAKGKEIISGKEVSLRGKLKVPARSPMVIEIN